MFRSRALGSPSDSCHTHEWVMAHTCMGYGTRMNESWHTDECDNQARHNRYFKEIYHFTTLSTWHATLSTSHVLLSTTSFSLISIQCKPVALRDSAFWMSSFRSLELWVSWKREECETPPKIYKAGGLPKQQGIHVFIYVYRVYTCIYMLGGGMRSWTYCFFSLTYVLFQQREAHMDFSR